MLRENRETYRRSRFPLSLPGPGNYGRKNRRAVRECFENRLVCYLTEYGVSSYKPPTARTESARK